MLNRAKKACVIGLLEILSKSHRPKLCGDLQIILAFLALPGMFKFNSYP